MTDPPITATKAIDAIRVVATSDDVSEGEKLAAIEALAAAAEPAPTRSLVRKLAEVLVAIERVPKRGRHPLGYAYATEADVAEVIRKELGSRSLFLFQNVEEVVEEPVELRRRDGGVRNSKITTVRITATFVDGDSGEEWSVTAYGKGEDEAEKGIYKALTGASKYLLMKHFLVSTGDDPEAGRADEEGSGGGTRGAGRARTGRNAPAPAAAPETPPRFEDPGDVLRERYKARGELRWTALLEAMAGQAPEGKEGEALGRYLAQDRITKLWHLGIDEAFFDARNRVNEATGKMVDDPIVTTPEEAAAAAKAAGDAEATRLEAQVAQAGADSVPAEPAESPQTGAEEDSAAVLPGTEPDPPRPVNPDDDIPF